MDWNKAVEAQATRTAKEDVFKVPKCFDRKISRGSKILPVYMLELVGRNIIENPTPVEEGRRELAGASGPNSSAPPRRLRKVKPNLAPRTKVIDVEVWRPKVGKPWRIEMKDPEEPYTLRELINYKPSTEPFVPDPEPSTADDELATLTPIVPVPQIKLGPNGEIMLDEARLVIEPTEFRTISPTVVEEEPTPPPRRRRPTGYWTLSEGGGVEKTPPRRRRKRVPGSANELVSRYYRAEARHRKAEERRLRVADELRMQAYRQAHYRY